MTHVGQESQARPQRHRFESLLPVIAPPLMIGIILAADVAESPKTAYVGLLVSVPLFTAIFGTPTQTAIAGAEAWLAALIFGIVSSDGNVPAQTIRLIWIALFSALAVFAAVRRRSREASREQVATQIEHAAQSERLARTDELTGLLNRRGILATVGLANADGPRTLALIDCDHFKSINDDFGHVAGDEYLAAVAGRLRSALPDSDLVGRWGGDEFLVVVNATGDGARAALDRLLHKVTSDPVRISSLAEPLTVSISVGAGEWAPSENLDDALRRADASMYAVKAAGGGAVEYAAD